MKPSLCARSASVPELFHVRTCTEFGSELPGVRSTPIIPGSARNSLTSLRVAIHPQLATVRENVTS